MNRRHRERRSRMMAVAMLRSGTVRLRRDAAASMPTGSRQLIIAVNNGANVPALVAVAEQGVAGPGQPVPVASIRGRAEPSTIPPGRTIRSSSRYRPVATGRSTPMAASSWGGRTSATMRASCPWASRSARPEMRVGPARGTGHDARRNEHALPLARQAALSLTALTAEPSSGEGLLRPHEHPTMQAFGPAYHRRRWHGCGPTSTRARRPGGPTTPPCGRWSVSCAPRRPP